MKTVCISEVGDGTYTVKLETEDPMGGENETPEQPFGSLEEAMAAVPSVFGAMASDKPAAPPMDGEEEFVAGFRQARGGEGMGY